MSQTKKTVIMFLVSALLGGGAWYLNTSGIMSGLSSSALSFGSECTAKTVKNQASIYRKSLINLKKIEKVRDEVEQKISTLRDPGEEAELAKQQKIFRALTRKMGPYSRFTKAYVRCQKILSGEIDPNAPATLLETPIASGEVTVGPLPEVTQARPERQPVATQAQEEMRQPYSATTETPSDTSAAQTTLEIIPEITSVPETTPPAVTTARSDNSAEILPPSTTTASTAGVNSDVPSPPVDQQDASSATPSSDASPSVDSSSSESVPAGGSAQ